MKNNKKLLLAIVPTLVLGGCASINNKENTIQVDQTANVLKLKGMPQEVNFFESLLKGILKKGSSYVTGQIDAFAGNMLNSVLESLGFDMRDDVTRQLDEIQSQISSISTTVDRIDKKLDKIRAEQVICDLFSVCNAFKTNMYPILAGMSKNAEHENDPTYSGNVKVDEINFYDNYIKNAKFDAESANFTAATIKLAETILTPNQAAPTSDLFAYYSLTLGSQEKWDIQTIAPQKQFVAYLSSLLMGATSIAQYQIAVEASKYSKDSAEYAYWDNYNETLVKKVNKTTAYFQTKLQSLEDLGNHIKESDSIVNYETNIKVSSRMVALSYNSKYDRDILSYRDTEWSQVSTGGSDLFYLRKTYKADQKLLATIKKDYEEYVAYYGLDKNSFSVVDYVEAIGFNFSKLPGATLGLYSNTRLESKGYYFTNEYKFEKMDVLGNNGEYDSYTVACVQKKVFKDIVTHTGEGYDESALCFLNPSKDGKQYLHGSYETLNLGSSHNERYIDQMEKLYPYTYDYNTAVSNSTLGLVKASW